MDFAIIIFIESLKIYLSQKKSTSPLFPFKKIPCIIKTISYIIEKNYGVRRKNT